MSQTNCISQTYNYSENLKGIYKVCTVSWDGSISDHFPVSNGVRQGGVLSPVL